MTSRSAFLNSPYGAYYHREVPEEDTELTHVGPGTPCGEYLRRFWQPVALLDELRDLPLAIRILDEDLVVFRDGGGQIGVLELHCPHRGTSLEFGQVSERGIRCCYHGWLMAHDGQVLETPGEPSDSTLKDRLRHGAYPTHVYRDIVFAYMGPPEKKPAFPIYDTFEMEGYSARPMEKYTMASSWLQIKENCMDPAHLDFLHIIDGNIGFTDDLKLQSELDWMETPVGLIYMSTRRVGDNVWVRIADFLPPHLHQFPAADPGGQEVRYGPADCARWAVPIDNFNTLLFNLQILPDELADGPIPIGFGQIEDRPYEERQRVPGDHDAQCSIHWGMVRPGLEHLATTDRGIIMLRRALRRGVQAVQRGEDPPGMPATDGELLPTYSGDTVLHIPRAPTPEEDVELLRRTARELAESYMKGPRGSRGSGA